MRSRILFISGRRQDARDLTRMLLDLPVTLDHVGSLRHARIKLRREGYTVVLTETALPDGTWMDALRLARESSPELETIVTDPLADARLWAEVLNLGAYDLLPQPFYTQEVRRILSNACSRRPVLKASMAAV